MKIGIFFSISFQVIWLSDSKSKPGITAGGDQNTALFINWILSIFFLVLLIHGHLMKMIYVSLPDT